MVLSFPPSRAVKTFASPPFPQYIYARFPSGSQQTRQPCSCISFYAKTKWIRAIVSKLQSYLASQKDDLSAPFVKGCENNASGHKSCCVGGTMLLFFPLPPFSLSNSIDAFPMLCNQGWQQWRAYYHVVIFSEDRAPCQPYNVRRGGKKTTPAVSAYYKEC